MIGGQALTSLAIGLALMAGSYGIVRLSRRLWRFLPAKPGVPLLKAPVPDGWPAIIFRYVPLTRQLGADERDRLLRLAQLLLHEVPVEGCNGLEVTDTMRVTIAATACLLLLHLPYPRFPTLRRILLYPDAFVPRRVPSPLDRGLHTEPHGPLLGEAHQGGVVILSWDSVLASRDAHNVVLHEFAHVLDGEDGAFNGIPVIEDGSLAEWGRVLALEFARAQEEALSDDEPALDSYAATNRAEFFAVATEAFFGEPQRLEQRLPEVYSLLQRFYRPAA